MNQRLNKTFKDVVYERQSCRAFLDEPIAHDVIVSVLEDAQQSPSNCNTQPWEVHIVTGDKLKDLSSAIINAKIAGEFTPDFSFDMNAYFGRYKERSNDQGEFYYNSLGIAREDKVTRELIADKNLSFFNAPAVAFLFLPSFGDNVRVAGDIGMYAQTFLLSLVDHNLAGIPQTYLGMFAETVRETLEISEDKKLLFGISFGYPDRNFFGEKFKMKHDSIHENVVFHF